MKRTRQNVVTAVKRRLVVVVTMKTRTTIC